MLTDSQRAALTARLRRGQEKRSSEIPRRPGGLTALPMSYGQEQLWFLDRFAPGLPTYNIPHALTLSGPLDPGALGRAIGELVGRHEALRTRLVADDEGRPVQVIDAAQAPPPPLEVVDLSGLEPAKQQSRLRDFIDVEASRPFMLAAGPLLRTWLLRLAGDEHVLLVVVHHAVFDGWSAGVLLRELAALYAQEASGAPAGLAELAVQFADFALWERDRLRGAARAELEGYWRGAMAGFETLQFPTDRPRPVLDSFEGGLAQHRTDLDLLDGLRRVSRRAGTTLFVTLMTGLQALLHRYTGQTDLVVGTVSANRARPELAPLIGFLVNTLPIRADLSGDPVFTELLARTAQATVAAYAHQGLPLGKLVETLGVARDASRAPVFQIALTYAERDDVPVCAAGVEFAMTDLVVGINAAKFDLTFAVEARGDGLWCECSYKTALFDAATVRRLLGNFEVLLRGVVADPSTRLSQLPVLTSAELRRELVEWNDTAARFPLACVHQGFEGQVAAAPHGVAAEFGDERLSYAELNRWANQIARRLRELGVGPEILAGVCMTTGLRRLAALLGIWKAGGGYVPLDPGLPAERLAFMITDTGMPVILTDDASAGRVPACDAVTVVSLDAGWAAITERADGELAGTELASTGVTPSNVAYVIYTSGSTGRPKGVVVEHRQAVNFLYGIARHWRIGPLSAVLQFAAFTFDVSVLDMFMPLLAGARVVLAPAQTLHAPPRLAALIRDRKITFACLPPAVLSLLGDEQFPDLRVLMTAGEELPSDLARRWVRPGLKFVNGYGPTEATVIATYQELNASMSPPPIGRPTWPNYRVYVLDAHLNPVPVGVTGELHIGGAGVARGYLNRPELTRQRFIPDPFAHGAPDHGAPDHGQRLYKTGDLVRRRPDGTIVFIGRADHQVKIRGLRVELGEIETALGTHPAIAQAVVTVVTDQAGEQQLAAYLRTEPGAAEPGSEQLRDHLARFLPGYMIPAYLTTVTDFPLGSSGKIDRSALPAPALPRPACHVAPATLLETMMASLYATLLKREQVGATDDFFDLGGNSLQAMRLIAMIGNELEVDVSAATVFLAPTPRQLAALLRDEHGFIDTGLAEVGGDGI
jgi:amino acid adenylation domain-containing protein